MKKTYAFPLLATGLFISLCATAQHANQSILFRHSESSLGPVAFNAPVANATQMMEAYHYADWKVTSDGALRKNRAYKRGLNNRNTGIGLLIGGCASLALSTVLLTDGIVHIRQANRYQAGSALYNIGRFYETYFGAAFGAAGIAMTIPGAVLLPRGQKQMKKAVERMAANP